MRLTDDPPVNLARRALLGGVAALPFLARSGWARPHAARQQEQADLGTLTPFYRGMQMQSQISGQDLISIPSYLLGSDLAFRYRVAPGFQREIPFVDSFSIARFLGGLRQDRVEEADGMDATLGRASLDYVLNPGGKLQHRPDIIRAHLQPYLAAGYALPDITIVTDNIPWGIARDQGATGSYGQKNPPANMDLWRETIGDLAADLHQIYGADASPNFKIGIEFDTKKSFTGDAQDYLDLYVNAYRTLRQAFPHARIAAAEFTGSGECHDSNSCVYDEADFLKQAAAAGASPNYVARSLNILQNRGGSTMPSDTVRRAVQSYSRLGSVVAEIHQFGLLGQPFGMFNKYGSDLGSRRAAWEFAVLMGLQNSLRPRRVFHWSSFYTPHGNNLSLINGIGVVRLILDHYLGATMTMLATGTDNAATEAMAVQFSMQDTRAIVLSNYGTTASSANVTVQLPQGAPRSWAFIRYGENNNAFGAIRQDLQDAGNLKSEFASAAGCTSDPDRMADNAHQAIAMVIANAQRYIAMTTESLRLKPLAALPYRLSQTQDTLSIAMPANELLVLQAV